MASSERQISQEEVKNWCEEFHVASFIETSAKTSQNVSAAFILAVRQWKKIERNTELAKGSDTIDLTRSVQLNGSEKTSCCSGSSREGTTSTQHEVLQ